MDIEGMELDVVPDMLMSGALAVVDEMHVDWTRLDPYVDTDKIDKLAQAMDLITQLAGGRGCLVEAWDDETFGGFDGPLPKC